MVTRFMSIFFAFSCICFQAICPAEDVSVTDTEVVFSEAVYKSALKKYITQADSIRKIMVDAAYYALYNEDIIGSNEFLDHPGSIDTIMSVNAYEAACVYLRSYFPCSGYDQIVTTKYLLSPKSQQGYPQISPIHSYQDLFATIKSVMHHPLLADLGIRSIDNSNGVYTEARMFFEYTIFFMALSSLEKALNYREEKYVPRMCVDYIKIIPEDLFEATCLGNRIVSILDFISLMTKEQKADLVYKLKALLLIEERIITIR